MLENLYNTVIMQMEKKNWENFHLSFFFLIGETDN